MPKFSVRHVTHYRYRKAVEFGEHRLMFRPRDSFDQRLLSADLIVRPQPVAVRWAHDVFGNCIALISFGEKADELYFETNIQLAHDELVPVELEIDGQARVYPVPYSEEEALDLQPTIKRSFTDQETKEWAKQFVGPSTHGQTGHILMTMCFAIHESFRYARRTDGMTQPPSETLSRKEGTCRDFALLMMEAARSLGFATRFVSGYIYVPDRDGSNTLGGGSTHAWCQIYLPGSGWVEFDPTNGIVGNRDLIRVAVARDPRQAVPLAGSYEGDADDFLDMKVQVNVTTVRERM